MHTAGLLGRGFSVVTAAVPHGQPAETGDRKAVTARGCYFARSRDGKIVEFHSHPDTAGMMAQLGLLPV
jgi:hypothetical protein